MYITEESPVSMELCDHSNNESESEENETGKADDIFKHDHKAFSLISGITSDLENSFILDSTPEHLEIPTPPPEFLLKYS